MGYDTCFPYAQNAYMMGVNYFQLFGMGTVIGDPAMENDGKGGKTVAMRVYEAAKDLYRSIR